MSEERGLTITQGASHLMPAMSMGDAVSRFNALATFTKEIMREGIDYGVIPGTGDKPTLLKPGAEKLTTFFGLSVHYEVIEKAEDWTGAEHGGEPFFYYWFRCQMYRGDLLIAEADGSCNSMESKYRWRWVSEDDIPQGYDKATLKTRRGSISEFTFAVDSAETTGKYGKPPEYWQQFKDAIENGSATRGKRKTKAGKEYDTWEIDTTVYRVPNEDVFSQVNTVQKMAQKRALVAATMLAVNASEYYTQDLEDLTIEGNFTVSPAPAAPAQDKGPNWADVPDQGPEPEPEEPFEGIPADHIQLMSALGPLGYYKHGKHALNAMNSLNGTKYNSWPQANPQFYADALPQLTNYANEQKALAAQEVVKATAEQMEL
jgi:hypothetical protein